MVGVAGAGADVIFRWSRDRSAHAFPSRGHGSPAIAARAGLDTGRQLARGLRHGRSRILCGIWCLRRVPAMGLHAAISPVGGTCTQSRIARMSTREDLDGPELLAFRQEVRGFVANELPATIPERVLRGDHPPATDYRIWQRLLHLRGWGAPHWPQEHGGTGWSAPQRHVFDEECALGGAPFQVPFGLRMVGPLLIRFGTAAQRWRVLPGILNGDDLWCQGFSEPHAGSDLGALATRATRVGAQYRLNGGKTWITLGAFAGHMLCLVRTGSVEERAGGLSLFMLDLSRAGVQRQPIRLCDGFEGEFCQ